MRDHRTQGEQSFRFEAQSLEDSLSVVGPRLDSLTLHHMEEIHLGAIIVDLDWNVLLQEGLPRCSMIAPT